MLRRREIICPIGVFDERQAIALSGKFVGRDQACERGAEDDNGLCVWGGHENRERSQIPAAIARRWLVVSRMRGPNTWYSEASIFLRILE